MQSHLLTILAYAAALTSPTTAAPPLFSFGSLFNPVPQPAISLPSATVSASVTATVSATVTGALGLNINTLPGADAAAISAPNGNTQAVVQNADGAIVLLAGKGVPKSGAKYTNTTLLASGKAKANTPLAVVDRSPNKDLSSIRFYYIGTDNFLKEYANDGSGWYDGDLNNYHFANQAGSKLLYVITDAAGNIRVGFTTSANVLAEAWYNGSWQVIPY